MNLQQRITEQSSTDALASLESFIVQRLHLAELHQEIAVDVVSGQDLATYLYSPASSLLAVRWMNRHGLLDIACVPDSSSTAGRLLYRSNYDAGDFLEELIRRSERLKMQWRDARKDVPTFQQLVCAWAAQGKGAATTSELAGRLSDMREQLAHWTEIVREQDDEIRRLKAERQFNATGFADATAAAESNHNLSEDIAQALGFEDVAAWYLENQERIVVLPRALNACKKARYEQPQHLYAGLEFLAGAYRQCRRGEITQDAMLSALESTGLRLGGSTSSVTAGEQGSAYFVSWQGRKRFLDLHLAKGGGRDERYCLRIYFFWCEQAKVVVVGSMPAHLDCSFT